VTPQVAAYADHHFLIQKSPKASNSMAMNVEELNEKEKVNELARLISGEKITSTSLAHAKELLKLHP
jgi:DNA repair protein RecN (Recombination protein N)